MRMVKNSRILKVLLSNNRFYLKACKKKVQDNYILFEAGQGKNINGNMFALLKEIEYHDIWGNIIPFFVVTNETKEKATDRFSRYGFKRVQLLVRGSKEYQEKLAVSKYLVTDNSFPIYFSKRDEQVYLNTWHGTPLKYLGRSDIKNAVSLGNIQKNYFSCDYALFPNVHTKNVFMQDYMLERTFQGNILMADYPRNSVLLDTSAGNELKTLLGLNDKKLIAYMPTWRGTGRSANGEKQIEIIQNKLKRIDDQLDDNQIMYVNLHFLIAQDMDLTSFKHIKAFPGEYETYEFLNICDILITDYSSVFFDFAITGRKIILFAYDKEEYLQDKGMYMDMSSLPFPIVEHVDDLIREINSGIQYSDDDFRKEFCAFTDKKIPEKILRLLILGEQGNLTVIKSVNSCKAKIYHVGDLKSKVSQELVRHLINELVHQGEKDIVLAFEGGVSYKKSLFLESIPQEVYFYSIVKGENKGLIDLCCKFLYNRFGIFKKRFDLFLEREKERLFYKWNPEKISLFLFRNYKFIYIYNRFDCLKEYYEIPYDYLGMKTYKKWFASIEKYISYNFYQAVPFHLQDDEEEIDSQKKYCGDTRCFLKKLSVKQHNETLKVNMQLRVESFRDVNFENSCIFIGNREYSANINVKLQKSNRYKRWKGKISFEIPFSDVEGLELQNKIGLLETTKNEHKYKIRILYDRTWKFLNKFRPIKIFFDETRNMTWFFRYPKDTLTITVREKNVTDLKKERRKVILAYSLSKILFFWKPILLFEKNASRYEESASVVFEKLIDEGIRNTNFVLDKSYEFKDQIPEKYSKKIIDKYSFKHYLCFFCAKTFIGSESNIHAFELRPISKLVSKKLNMLPHNYVFLQHGVMYMISLDSERRSFFRHVRRKNIVEKTVVSSELEAEHFIKLGGYSSNDLYLCGLPKFDKNEWSSSADKIVIMITWRPWEYIQSVENIEDTTYFQMLKKIVHSIPQRYRSKVIVLPHPLVEKQMRNENGSLNEFIPPVIKYDDVLKMTKVLITDYSSISYDAFYRGCNVIFCWQEKEACLKEYGNNAKLMLTEELAFGDVCYDYSKLSDIVEKVYNSDQQLKFLENYQKIVSFHDGHNTDRLIGLMKQDHII